MTKSQLEVVNDAAKQAARGDPAVAPAPPQKQSRVKTAALKGAAAGAGVKVVLGALNMARDPSKRSAVYAAQVAKDSLIGAGAAAAMFASAQRDIERADEMGAPISSMPMRVAKAAAIHVGLVTAGDLAMKAAGIAKFGAKRATYAALADAHERRARSARSGRSALLHNERAAELRALCVRSVRHTTP